MVKVDELQKYCREIEEAVSKNPHCKAGAFGALRAYFYPQHKNLVTERLEYPELLALLNMTEEGGYWYAYIGNSLKFNGSYVSLIVRVSDFINCEYAENLFGHFCSMTTSLGKYHPCKIQNSDDAYAEANNFQSAVKTLITMIQRFDPALRDPDFPSPHYTDSYEMRVFDYFGFRRWI